MSVTQVDRETFLYNLRQSGLVSSRECRDVLERVPDTDRGRAVARALVEKGLLTKFQAELLLIGRTAGFFLGQYKIIDQIGQGGMGRVYKAIHQTMNRVVALKVLAPHLMKTTKAQKLFRREVQAAARLIHPNIVTAYDANKIQGRHYLAMEYVSGPNLDQLIRAKGPLKVGAACEIIRQAALGLEYAHEHGMVHRDIKPANLLLQRSRSKDSFLVKILDFGLARLQAPDAAAGTIVTNENLVMGTPDFLSPEQARSLHQVDIRADIYSLGCCFYVLLTGQVPFAGGTTLEKLIRHSSEDPEPVTNFRQDVPEEVLAVLARMMARDPDDRFQTPAEIIPAMAPFAAIASTPWDSATHPVAEKGELSAEDTAQGQSGELATTLPADMSVTPMSASGEGSLIPWSEMTREIRRHSRKAALLGIGVLAGLLAGLLFALWLMQ